MLRTEARPAGDGWVLDGEKWFITGGAGAAFAIVMARTEGGATMFLVDAATEGLRGRGGHRDHRPRLAGGHARIRLEDCFVPADQVLGEAGRGFRYAQVRLAPARLTHCMRWLGLARRALDVALARAVDRELFGSRLADLGLAQRLVADAEIDLQTSRLMIAHVAELLDAGRDAGVASSMAKVHVSEAVFRVIDSAIQLCGSDGITVEPLGRYLAEVRPFRIYDGSNETHRWSIARRAARAVERARPRSRPDRGPPRRPGRQGVVDPARGGPMRACARQRTGERARVLGYPRDTRRKLRPGRRATPCPTSAVPVVRSPPIPPAPRTGAICARGATPSSRAARRRASGPVQDPMTGVLRLARRELDMDVAFLGEITASAEIIRSVSGPVEQFDLSEGHVDPARRHGLPRGPRRSAAERPARHGRRPRVRRRSGCRGRRRSARTSACP
jgi:hypothetical protein